MAINDHLLKNKTILLNEISADLAQTSLALPKDEADSQFCFNY